VKKVNNVNNINNINDHNFLTLNTDILIGMEQSPIDLPPPEKAIGSPIKALFQFEEVAVEADADLPERDIKSGQALKIKYHENALRIYGPNLGKTVTMDGGVYIAQEYSFHTPSEHKLNGKRYPLEIQVVHYGKTVGDTAKQLVLSFLFEKKAGYYNRFIDTIDVFNLPNPLDSSRDLSKPLFLPNIFYSQTEEPAATMMPFSFYTYQGSMSKPPCAEKTIHYVATEPIGCSNVVFELLKEALRIPDLQDPNGYIIVNENSVMHSNRATQDLHGRPVFYYDYTKYNCPVFKKKLGENIVNQEGGHYERKPSTMTNYFFVEGNKPSGMPGAFVVTEGEATNSPDVQQKKFIEQELREAREKKLSESG
jgi:carbonic anhydrase